MGADATEGRATRLDVLSAENAAGLGAMRLWLNHAVRPRRRGP